jgi:MtN3 and saliva related transmembrane protein
MPWQQMIGWAASAILVLTILTQVYRQWQQGSSKGVSKWLFAGQIGASSGFFAYSWLIHDPVFMATNLLTLLGAVIGLAILLWHRERNPDESDG